MSGKPDPRWQRFREAYLLMARDARYRPQAPSDGLGNIMLSEKELADEARLELEASSYAIKFMKEEDDDEFFIGCSDFTTNRAFVWTIEAARLLASPDIPRAIKLLEMAIDEIKREGRDMR